MHLHFWIIKLSYETPNSSKELTRFFSNSLMAKTRIDRKNAAKKKTLTCATLKDM